jgi:hypothetical protein
LSILAQLINSSDVEVLTDACWAFCFLSEGRSEWIAHIIQTGVVQRFVQLLLHPSGLVQTPALRFVGNITTTSYAHIQILLQNGGLENLRQLLAHHRRSITREACWTISNITAGTKDQVKQVISNGVIAPVIRLLDSGSFEVKKEALWILCNATATGDPTDIAHIVHQGCLGPMLEVLTMADVVMVSVALQGLEYILRCGKHRQAEAGLLDNPVVKLIEEADGVTKIEALQQSPAARVYKMATLILQTYFPLDDDDNVEFGRLTMSDFGCGVEAHMPQVGFNFDDREHVTLAFG